MLWRNSCKRPPKNGNTAGCSKSETCGIRICRRYDNCGRGKHLMALAQPGLMGHC